jgi:hypothetical protein
MQRWFFTMPNDATVNLAEESSKTHLCQIVALKSSPALSLPG